MPTTLRHIAVHVEEPSRGKYAWVLSEASESGWVQLAKTKHPARTYKSAMADGLMALQALVEDLDVGPREPETGDDAQETPEMPADGAPSKSNKAQASERRYFGFGPVR